MDLILMFEEGGPSLVTHMLAKASREPQRG
jgi:hypothetical protein